METPVRMSKAQLEHLRDVQNGACLVENKPWKFWRPCRSLFQAVFSQLKNIQAHLQGGVLLQEERENLRQKAEQLDWWIRVAGLHLELATRCSNNGQRANMVDLFGSVLRLDDPFTYNILEGVTALKCHQTGRVYRLGSVLHSNAREERHVYEATEISSNQEAIVKTISKQASMRLYRERMECDLNDLEIRVMRSLRSEFAVQVLLSKFKHPCVNVLKCFFESQTLMIAVNPRATMSLMDLVSSQTKLPKPALCSIACQMVAAISFLTNLGLVHRDLKLENFVVSEPRENELKVELIDFGLVTGLILKNEAIDIDPCANNGVEDECPWMPQEPCQVGTLYTMAPEVYEATRPYDAVRAEVWSLGVCLFLLFAYRRPFRVASLVDDHFRRVYSKGAGAVLEATCGRCNRNQFIDEQIVALIDRMMVVNPENRAPNFNAVAQMLLDFQEDR